MNIRQSHEPVPYLNFLSHSHLKKEFSIPELGQFATLMKCFCIKQQTPTLLIRDEIIQLKA